VTLSGHGSSLIPSGRSYEYPNYVEQLNNSLSFIPIIRSKLKAGPKYLLCIRLVIFSATSWSYLSPLVSENRKD